MSSKGEGYNGWTNYETWATHLWISNSEESDNFATSLAAGARKAASKPDEFGLTRKPEGVLADALKEWIEEEAPDLPASLYSDLLSSALGRVDWYEIARAYLEEGGA